MKKYFRLLGVALIATSMCLVSCGGDENDENGTNGNNENVTPGVEVTFAGQTWQADYISALTNGTAIQIIATPASGLTNINCVDENQQVIGTGKFAEPCLKIQSVAQQGEMSVQGADLENADFLVTYMVTKDNDFYFFSSASSTTPTAWFGYVQNDLTLNITELTSTTVSGTVRGTMFHVYDAGNDEYSFDPAGATDIKNISVKFTKIGMQSASKFIN